MKVGLTVDSEGEEIDYNKVDTALKSVGISIKDAQGQFRDFDDVIFELSEKWDSLDKNTQRYIATIMAGNRQQSRFIALVDNWERLDEVTKAAADSQDAGLLQYSKTLDSLETKLTNIKTSFQQFYMSIINGPVISFFLELGNSILQAFNKLGAIQSIFNVLSWIRTIKMLANLIFKGFERPITKIVTSYKQRLEEMTRLTGVEAFKAGQIYAQQFNNGMNSRLNGRVARRRQNGGYSAPNNQQQNGLFGWGSHQKMGQAISIGGQLAGTLLSSISTVTANSNATVSTWTGVGGNVASIASMGAVLGPWGAAAGALLGAVTSLHEVADIEAKQAQIDYENAQKAADDANIKRAETKNNSDALKSLIDQYKVADKNKNDSQENYDNWLSLNQQLADMYPALISYMDEEGNAIVNITEASLLLEDAFRKTTSATLDYYNKEILKRRAENAAYGATAFEAANTWGADAAAIAKLFGSDNHVWDGVNVVHEANGAEGVGEVAWEAAKGLFDAQNNASIKNLYGTFGDLMEYVRYLQGVSSDKQYTRNGVTYINAGSGKGYGADWAAQGLLQIGVIQYDEASGAYSLSDAAKEYDPNFENSAELRGLLKARSLQHLSNLSNESFMDDSLAGIEGFNGFYYHYLKTIKDLSDDQIALLTDISYDDYLSPISDFYNELNTTNKNLFNGLISNINDYSFNALKNLLQILGAPEEITATFEQQWQQSNNQWQILLARQYAQQAGRDPNLIFHWNDFESFSEDFGYGRMKGYDFAKSANGDVQTAWLNYLAQYALDNQKRIFGNLNAAEAQKYLSWYSDTSDLDNSIGVEKDVTRSRRNWIIERYNETFDPNSVFAGLDEAQRVEFRDLLLTDDGSAEWANKIEQYAQQYEIEITGLAGIERYVFENLNTRTAQFTDSVSSYTEKIKKLTDKQKDGYTMSEAQALAELRGMPLFELFEVNESGLLVLRDLRAEQARVLQEELEKGRNLKEKYRLTRDRLLKADAAGYSQRSIIAQAINAETEEETMSLLSASIEDLIGPDAMETLGIDGELAKQLTMEIRNGTITTYEEFIAYLEKQLELLEITEDQYNKITAELQNEQDRTKFSEKYQADISATGLDKLFGGTLIDAEGVFSADWGSVDAAGNLLIDDYKALLDALAEVLGEDSEAFRAWRKAIIAQSADVEKDVNKSLVDVISKMQLAQMYGLQRVQLTNDEIKALYESYAVSVETPDDFDTWADYHGFSQTGTGYEFNTAYATGDWNTNGYTWDEFFYTDDGWLGIGGALDTATTTALYEAKADLIKIIEGLNLDSDYSSVKKFFDAGILTEEQYQAFFTSGQTAYEYLMSILSQSANAEVQAAVKKAKDAVALEEALELDSSRLNLEDNFINLFQNISETSLQDIQGIYEQIYGEDSFTPEIAARYQTALDQAREGTVQPLINLLYELAHMANSSDKGFEVDTAKLNSAYKDANNSLISGLAQSLNSGISGTLSNIDFNNLIEQIGKAPEDYRRYVTETYDGLKLSAEGALVIASQLIDKFDNTSLVVESLVAQLGGSGALGSYEDVDNLINDIINDTDHWAHGNEEILKLLYQMRDEYSQLAEDAQFDFMNQDHFDGAADNWYTFTDNMSTAIDKLKAAFEKGGKIDYKSFDNIVTWISNLSVDGLDTQLGNIGKTLGEFIDDVLATVDATGNLDLSAAAANLGISMDDMAGALEGGLQEVAKQQVAYWKHYLNFLKGIKALQEASDEIIVEPPQVDINNGGKYTYGGQDNLTAEQAYSYWLTDVYKNFEDLTITDFDGNTVQIFSGNNNPLRQLMSFKPELFTIGDDGSVQIKEGMTSYVQQYMNQLSALVKQEFATGDITKYIDQETGAIKIPWNEVLQIEIDTSGTPTGTANNAKEAGEQTQDAAEGAAESALTASGATPTGDGSYTYTLDDMTLKIQMGANGSVEIDLANATGTLPSAAELRKVFEGQEGFTATDDNNWVFTDPNLGFSVKCSNGTLSFDTSGMTAPAAPTAAELSAILGTTWTTTDGGKTYTTNLNGVTFTYESTTGTINVDPSDFTVSANLTADQLKTLLGGSWTSEDGITYKSTINGVTFTYESTTGELVVTPPTTATEPANTDFITLMQAQGWAYENGVYTKDFGGGTLTYNATAGALNITPSATMAAANPDMATLLDSAFGAGGWQPNENGGYDILNATTGEVLYTLPAKITVAPTAGSNVTSGDNGLTADVDVTLTPNTNAIDAALAAYNNQPIKISLELTNSKNSLLNSPAYNDIIAKTRAYLDKNLSTKDMQTAYYQAYSAFSPYIPSMSREDLEALQQLQSSIDFGLFINESTEDPWWTALGEEVSAALEALPEEGELTGITALFNSLSGENLAANLLGITSLFSTLVAPELATLDLTGFITQLQSMGELELDDEEINAFVTAITALTTAITALPTEVNVSVKVSAGTSYSVISGIKRALDSIKNKTVTITTKHVNSGGDGGDGDENSGTPTDASYAGNVSGLALAKGNATDKLLAGAHLAGKTLVGELGPELAVYDNQYHLLGRDGAEFVDLPSDAIVFNHRQTAGIIKGQAGYRGQALVNGNVTGPAAAGGIDSAISAVEKIIKLWSNIADSSLSDLLSGGSGGGGGSGNSIQAVTAELIEWYNLTRKIAKVEADINQLTAERENIHKRDGAAYLRNLREETKLLQEQHSYNAILRDYKKAQLDRQAREINENQYWSQFMHVDENGLLQYNFGNETDGGKGTLKDLQDFVEMSGEEQQAFLKGIGYSYTTADGEVLEGTELAEMFLEEAQSQIDNYDALYDSWRELGIELENLEQQVAEIEEEIKNNQIELEQDIYDIIVEAWEKEIEAMEEHAELVKEAGEEYVSGLRDAISAEKDMYDRNQATADREQLQRQLALLRRSGGSASEIANLENQLDDMFKDEYFNNQEQMIEDIAKANDEQNKKLEEQIRIQQESLEYQKEHGLIWQQVYDVMSGTTEEILAFMQGRSTEFFTQSLLGQEEMLTEWAHKVGIYTEERAIQSAGSAGLAKYWDNGAVWNNSAMAGLQNFYNSMSQEDQDFVRKQFATAYGAAINNGSTEAEAYQAAVEAVSGHLGDRQSASLAQEQEASHTTQGTAADYRYVQGGNLHLRANASTSSTSYGTYGTGTKVKVLSDEGEWCKVEVNGKTGYMMSKYLAKSGSGSGSSNETGSNNGTATKYRQYYTVTFTDGTPTASGYGSGSTEQEAKNNAYYKANQKKDGSGNTGTIKLGKLEAFAQGGLVDYTGLAMVHGKPSKPEAFLNASQTKLITDSLKIAGDGGALDHLRSAIEKIRALAQGFQTIKYNNPSISIAPGAITIQVAELADSYDIEDISRDIMDRINTIAAKATSRSVNRR